MQKYLIIFEKLFFCFVW